MLTCKTENKQKGAFIETGSDKSLYWNKTVKKIASSFINIYVAKQKLLIQSKSINKKNYIQKKYG